MVWRRRDKRRGRKAVGEGGGLMLVGGWREKKRKKGRRGGEGEGGERGEGGDVLCIQDPDPDRTGSLTLTLTSTPAPLPRHVLFRPSPSPSPSPPSCLFHFAIPTTTSSPSSPPFFSPSLSPLSPLFRVCTATETRNTTPGSHIPLRISCLQNRM